MYDCDLFWYGIFTNKLAFWQQSWDKRHAIAYRYLMWVHTSVAGCGAQCLYVVSRVILQVTRGQHCMATAASLTTTVSTVERRGVKPL